MRAGPGSVWVLDRWLEGALLIDQDLLLCATRPLESPRCMAQGADVLWVVCASASQKPGLRLLGWRTGIDLNSPAFCNLSLGLGDVHELWASEQGTAYLLLSHGAGRRLCSVDLEGCLRVLLHFESELHLGFGEDTLLVSDRRRQQRIAYHLEPEVAIVRAVSGDLEGFSRSQRSSDGGWWCLAGMRGERLERWSASLALVWSQPVGFLAQGLVDYGQGVMAAGGQRLAARCFGLNGQAGPLMESEIRGPLRAAQRHGEGYLVALPGALLVLSPLGEITASQGGFGEIVGLTRNPHG